MSFYGFARGVVDVIFTPIYRFKAIGTENVPKDGAVLLCANHIHNLDPIAVGVTTKRHIVFMAKEELFKVPILGNVVKHLQAFPVKRGKGDREALRMGLAALREGKVLGLFPEGTRSKTGEVGKGMAGAGFFALKTDAHVVPCAIVGPYKPFKRVKVVYGKPIDMQPLRERKASAEEVTELIMTHIKEILIQYK
ncbi:1-acyl-sn-glycerol-3-phosphate acyltransferase [Caldibacillus lycopersici]|uniref:1-acyl-sn-glycerol-3-phosphate acyltransferase n=1 Tax=Perspicuibacillus lycopersici TaxID=1325689 RepID=A0AAE3LNC9_9BACI|nr:lysophospholipid acyltransferase family protein [Perspicuibacillus lycopersici]MCU9613722.1 1-acyl-sn-glycerol-3-phosphate acyltransferase [Perspicuibacillus lycopersici]